MKNILLTAVLLLVIISCKNSVEPAKEKGTISGQILNNLSDVKVQIEGTNIYSLTNSTGSFSLNNVESGVYDLMITKSNYDTIELFGIPYPGNGNLF
ncbi:MAG: carboxypeptidase-like regulatory domain-containing protein [Candidatus Kapabacteria bacterium]|nr:carboxypeptidase-like regulatory domain-containing protein [Candidatus Kapabacteria bacterium]